MSPEILPFAAVALLGVLPLALGRRHRVAALIAAVAVAAVATTAGAFLRADPKPETLDLPREARTDAFVSSRACMACHPGEHASWHRTYHRSMTQKATPHAVVGDFDDVHLEALGRSYHLERVGEEFWVDMVDPAVDLDELRSNRPLPTGGDEPRVRRKVVLTTGSHHQQTYWVPLDGDRSLFQLPWSWIIAERRWIPREDAFLTAPSDERTPAVWNALCIRCHATGGRPERDFHTNQLDSEVVDFGIACESCHGPGRAHIEANRNPARRYMKHFAGTGDPTIVNPERLPHDLSTQVCGQCHSIHVQKDNDAWWRRGDLYRAGDELDDTRRIGSRQTLNALSDTEFWPDGVYRVGGREYNGLIDSACYTRGELSCLSCHSMHDAPPNDQLADGMDGDEACLQCHEPYRADIEAHTRHRADSVGSRCYSCHMPHTTYALFTAIRSHRIDSPTVEMSARHDRPNACNLCHLDQTLAWTARWLQEWYAQEPPWLLDEQREVAASVSDLLRGDAALRVLIAWHYGWQPAMSTARTDWMPPYLAQLLADPYAAVRQVAHTSLRRQPGFADFAYDYDAAPEELEAARDRALEQWLGATSEARPAVLIDTDGNLDRAAFGRLLARRDDRPVRINE